MRYVAAPAARLLLQDHTRAKNLAASTLFAGLAFAVYRYSPHTVDLRLHTPSRISLNGAEVLSLAFCVYLLALTYFFLCNAAVVESRTLIACRGLRKWLRHTRRL